MSNSKEQPEEQLLVARIRDRLGSQLEIRGARLRILKEGSHTVLMSRHVIVAVFTDPIAVILEVN